MQTAGDLPRINDRNDMPGSKERRTDELAAGP